MRSPALLLNFRTRWHAPRRIFDLIEEEPQMPEPEDAVDLKDIRGNVRVEDVSFSYVPEQKLIEHFNLEVRPRAADRHRRSYWVRQDDADHLLMRFYDVDAGRICVEDTDIREMTRRSLRAGFGMVLQDTWLKTGTIRDNITMGRPDATDEEVTAAAKASHTQFYPAPAAGV